MSDEKRPDAANGCDRCGIVGCPLPSARSKNEAAKAVHQAAQKNELQAAHDSWLVTHEACNEAFAICSTNPAVNWQSYAARLVEEQRAKAMEAAARVWARGQYGGDWMRVDFGQVAVERLANGKRPYAPADHAALEVLRAFEIVK